MTKNEEFELIASLKNHPGYVSLLEIIQSDIDTLTDILFNSPPEKRDEYYYLVKTLRFVLAIFKSRPEEFSSQVDSEKLGAVINVDAADRLLKLYNIKKELKESRKVTPIQPYLPLT